MNAEIVAVGTELLLGQIVNTNAQYIAQGCAGIGLNVYYQTVVGDNLGRIKEVFSIASSRADVIICTGGLGPTRDDLTKDALADYLGLEMTVHEPSLRTIEEAFRNRGGLTENNARQANLLAGCDPLPNDNGLAVGVALTLNGKHYILLPGPPREMKLMFDRYALPWLKSKMGGERPLFSKMLKFAGIGESLLENRLLDLIDGQDDPTIAPYAKEGETAIRLTTRASSAKEAEEKLAATEAEIRRRAGEHLFSEEDIPLEAAVVQLLKRKGKTAALAESCTGGMVSELLTSVPGSSAVLRGSFVSYTNEMKQAMLGVPKTLLEGEGAPGAVSPETAAAMAAGALERTGADFAVSITGVAGPGPSEGKPEGLVYIGVAVRGGDVETERLQYSGGRETVRIRAAKYALYKLWQLAKA